MRNHTEKVILDQQTYIKAMVEKENLSYRLARVQEYVVSHKHIDRECLGALLGIPSNMLKGEE